MSSPLPPAEFAHLVNLAADVTGTFVLYANDDFFAPKENLIRPDAPVWKEEAYTDRGKWMDGWESQRRRTPGHDDAIIRLGTPGAIHGVLCDTTHFKGNAPQAVSIEICDLPETTSVEVLNGLPVVAFGDEAPEGERVWREVLPRTDIKPDFGNVLPLPLVTGRATHLRLRIFPDGGVSRLRVYGEVLPTPRTFWQPASVDLAAVESGGTVAAVSDQFFGPPSNLLLPGRGVNMGDGWETKRRRTPGSDWCVIKLGRRGVVQRIELDTHFFKGNAPQATLIECLDEAEIGPEALAARLRADIGAAGGWRTLVGNTPLVQHRKHIIEPARVQVATHLRVHIFPHGGVNRLRLFGFALDTEAESEKLDALNDLQGEALDTLLRSFNGSSTWAATMASVAPHASVRDLFLAAEAAWWTADESDFLEAFAAHPRIGGSHKAEAATARSATWSAGEQAQVGDAEAETRAHLFALNERYFEKFGFIFICFATGRSAEEMLGLLQQRIENSRAQEIENAATEQARITRLRIEKWLLGR